MPFSFIVVPGIRHRRDSDLYNRWLRQLLPKDFPDSRILLFNYDALHIFGGTRLLHATRHFLDNLVEKRRHDPLRPIIFLAHSVGGIFLKYALLQAWKTPKYRSIKESAGGIVFFGTPHHGFPDDMSMEALVHLIAGRLLVPSRCLSTPYATDLLQGSGLVKLAKERLRPLEAAATVHQRWLDAYRRQLRIVSFYETVPAVSFLGSPLGGPVGPNVGVRLCPSLRLFWGFQRLLNPPCPSQCPTGTWSSSARITTRITSSPARIFGTWWHGWASRVGHIYQTAGELQLTFC